MSLYIFLLCYIYHLCFKCIDFYDLSAWDGCLFVVYIRRFIYKFLNVCPFDYTAVAGSGKVGPVHQVNHTSLVAVVTPTDRPKSVRNRDVIELFLALFELSLCPFDISVGVWVIVRGLSQISFFLVHLSRRLKCTIVIMRCRGLWLAETSSTSPLKPLNGIQRNLTESNISMSSTKFVFFWPTGKTRWPPWPLIGWNIFDFSSENCWTEFKETWYEARSQRPLPSLCFSGRSEKQDGRRGLWLAETFSTFPLKPLSGNSTKLDRKQHLNVLYQVCVFRADRKYKMAALVSDWLRHFSTSPLKPQT